ncbi:hypothetical protein T459_27549 [Capsicum annuum]|uniref:Uncharacterized protein n=1 Tax=Capsicum annuum TaxID=4072 RepID=A0A2G2YE87_CAPAN|nr:hypothetical protein T459_27549 [Capsicum annuum]
MQKVVAEFNDWEMVGGEEEMMVSVGEPLPRVVFGGAPSLQQATEATADLKHALEKYRFLDVDICRGDISELSLILICNIVRFLKKQQHFNSVVASITCDPNVWNAVMQNPALQEFLDSQKTSASFPDSDHKIDEFVTEADSFSQSSRMIAFSKSEEEESKFGNSFIDFLQNVTQIITQTVVDMMNNLSYFFNNLLRGYKVFLMLMEVLDYALWKRYWEHLSWAWQSWL